MNFFRLAGFVAIFMLLSTCSAPIPTITPTPSLPPAPTRTPTAFPWVSGGQTLSNPGRVRCPFRAGIPHLYPGLSGGLRELAEPGGMWIGSAVGAGGLRGVNVYSQTTAREFNMIVPEVALKFELVQPEPGVYNFCEMDTVVAFAQANEMLVRGHPLVWDQQLPAWARELQLSREQWTLLVQEHITQLVSRYPDVIEWDVINEPFTEDGTFKETLWYNHLGPAYIEQALRWSHEANPDARLFINEFATENLNPKSDALYALAQELLAREVPLHGIGFQMHLYLGTPPDPEQVAANFQRFAELGLEVQITELDIRIKNPVTSEKLERQAHLYQAMLMVCRNAPNCDTVVLWGVSDRVSWIQYLSGDWASPLLLDEAYLPKPAYWAFAEGLRP